MPHFLIGVLFLVAALILPRLLKQANVKISPLIVSPVCIVIAAILMISSFVVRVLPGQIARVYPLIGETRTLSTGPNYVLPWDKIVTWDGTAHNAVFMERGNEDDPNDAFGGQTKNGDYMTTVANISFRIDPSRLDEYIAINGYYNINEKIEVSIKGVLKGAFESSLEKNETESVMSNKSKIVAEARETALERLKAYPIVVVELSYPDIVAAPEYEAAIRKQADLRMQAQEWELQKTRNEKEAAANKAQADGEAAVKNTLAKADADVKAMEADGEARATEAKATAEANAKKIKANADAEAIRTMAAADAEAMLKKANAQAEGDKALGLVFAAHPELLEVQRIEAQKAVGLLWNGMLMPQFGGNGNGLGFTNYTDAVNALISAIGLKPTQDVPNDTAEVN